MAEDRWAPGGGWQSAPYFFPGSNNVIIDLFAGGGGASVGIEAATGLDVDIAVNHDATALAVHAANHPRTKHLETDVFEVSPRATVGRRKVDLLWASPDCTHFSVAKGDVPRSKGIRSLAWVVVDWAREVRPRLICLENVAEFQGWGPLGEDGRPDKSRMGETFNQWRGALELLGYTVDYRVLDASRYGAPTKRRRLFLVARSDGQPISWPEPTHGPGLQPFRTAAECIDWSLPCPSIFERKRPLAEKTLWRIAQGIRRFVLETAEPFIVEMNHSNAPRSVDDPLGTVTTQGNRFNLVAPVIAGVGGRAGQSDPTGMRQPVGTITSKNDRVVVAPTLIQTGYGERPGQRPRYLDLHTPIGTLMGGGQKHALVSAFLAKHFGGVVGIPATAPVSTITNRDHHSLAVAALAKFRGDPGSHDAGLDPREPLPTVSAQGNHVAEVRAFLTAYYSSGSVGQAASKPLRTVTAKHRLGLVTVSGVDYQIVDIGMRMLEPHELLRAQFGRFAADYDLSAATTKSAKVRLIGNSVCPEVAEAVVRANWTSEKRRVAA